MVLICVVVLYIRMFRLAPVQRYPDSLLWVAVIIAIYTYIASRLQQAVISTQLVVVMKATKLFSSIDTNKFISLLT